MKRHIIFLFTALILLGLDSCHKYPDDIPTWLKEKIKSLDKETRWHKGCMNDHCMTIDECSFNGETKYFFDPGNNDFNGYQLFIIYDYNGNEECHWIPAIPSTYCEGYSTAQKIRRIWGEKD